MVLCYIGPSYVCLSFMELRLQGKYKKELGDAYGIKFDGSLANRTC